jgi:TQXA domain-containing protein
MRCLRLLTLLAVFLLLTQTNFGQYKKGAGDTPQDYTSIAKVSGTADGTGVSFQNSSGDNFNNFAGTFNGTLNDNAEKFYCIDLYHPLATNQDYWDEGRTPSEITYILNNFFPFTDHPNALSDNNEAAAVQLAIWSFSDDAVISSIGNSTIKNRAQAIVDETNANHEAFLPVETLEIVPVSQTLSQGTPAQFSIVVKDINGDGVGNVEVSLSTNKGNLSASTVTTNANGEAGPIDINL